MNKKKPSFLVRTGAFILWLITTALGMLAFIYFHSMAFTIYMTMSGYHVDQEAAFDARYQIGTVRNFSLVIFSMIWLLIFLITSGIHYKYVGKPRSWRLFAWMLGIEILILTVNYIFFLA